VIGRPLRRMRHLLLVTSVADGSDIVN
jgi:hypothetical protein